VSELDDDEIKQTAPSLMCFLMSQETLETIDPMIMNFFLKGNYENSRETLHPFRKILFYRDTNLENFCAQDQYVAINSIVSVLICT